MEELQGEQKEKENNGNERGRKTFGETAYRVSAGSGGTTDRAFRGAQSVGVQADTILRVGGFFGGCGRFYGNQDCRKRGRQRPGRYELL